VCITDDGKPIMSAGLMRRALQYSQLFGTPVMVHEEDLTLSAGGAMNEGPMATRLGLRGIPPAAEVAMVARDLVLLEEFGGHLHIAHASCEGSVRLIREAQRRGLKVTAEATPHHFTLREDAVGDYDTHAKMMPPLRERRDVEAIREGLADGTIQAIATDHAPHGVLDKHVEFDKAMNGIVGLETSVPLTLALVRDGILTPRRAVELLSEGPARAFKLAGGHLGVGSPADVTVIDPDSEYVVDRNRFYSKSRNSPFHGWRMKGQATHTVVGGRVVFDGRIREEEHGR
jgi:dihydroorotase